MEEDPIGQIDHKSLLIDGTSEYILKVSGGCPLLFQPKLAILSSDENCIDAFATTCSKGTNQTRNETESEKEKKSVRKPNEERIPKEADPACDKNHPKYFLLIFPRKCKTT